MNDEAPLIHELFEGFTERMFEVGVAILPMVVIFLILQFFVLKLRRRKFQGILINFVITYVGLVLFMHGAMTSFMPIGEMLGEKLSAFSHPTLLIPIGFAMGFVVAFAEPAVRVLNKQVYDASAGAINQKLLLMAISIGVAIAIALAMIRILAGFSIWWIIAPGYALIFACTRFIDPTFAALAFDSGGVATGPMCSTFVMSFCLAVSKQFGTGNALTDGMGMVALVAMAPILSIMTMSVIDRIGHYREVKRTMSELNHRR